MKVCLHVDQSERWKTCLSNIINTIKYAEQHQEDIPLVVVTNSEAVSKLANRQENQEFLQELKKCMLKGVRVFACANALEAYDLKEEDLFEGIDVVPAGIIAIAEKQAQGYAYIRP